MFIQEVTRGTGMFKNNLLRSKIILLRVIKQEAVIFVTGCNVFSKI